MATLTEIATLYFNGDLINKTSSALVKAVQTYVDNIGIATIAEKSYTDTVFKNPKGEAVRVLRAVIADNEALALSAILALSDAAIQASVNASLQVFIDADEIAGA